MHHFHYAGTGLQCEQVSLETLARRFGTPLFVYSERTLTGHYQRLNKAMAPVDHQVCFAVKSNSNLGVLRVLANQGSGFDIVSGGELQRVIAAGGDPGKCVFAGVGKSEEEIAFALRHKVYSFNVESDAELQRINLVAQRLRRRAPIALRVNPDVDAKTHAKITTGTYENKFGIAFEQVESLYARAARLPNLWLRGVQMHIGSQLTSVKPFVEAVRKVAPLSRSLQQQYNIEFLSIGGGIGIVYDPALASGRADWWTSPAGRKILTPERYAQQLVPLLKPLNLRILMEPGRFISGNAGVLVARVEYVKKTGRKNFVIVDAAMNDLIRPAFYEAYHEIVPTTRRRTAAIPTDVVGPICESGDTFCKDRRLPRLKEGDYIALLSAGAYGSVMGSTYNSRPLPAEVLVRGNRVALVRRRQRTADIWADESVAPWSR
jgi:diaminopimelate decarboxylase